MKTQNILMVVYTKDYAATVENIEKNTPEGLVQSYAFKNTNPNIKEGDFVVVNSRNGLGIGIVVQVIEDTFENAEIVNKATNYVVDKFSVDSIRAVKEAEERRKYLKLKLEEKKAKMEDYIIYKAIANEDAEAAKMLEELKALS